MRVQYTKETCPYLSIEYVLMYNFELIWPGLATSEQIQLICDSQKNQLYPSTD